MTDNFFGTEGGFSKTPLQRLAESMNTTRKTVTKTYNSLAAFAWHGVRLMQMALDVAVGRPTNLETEHHVDVVMTDETPLPCCGSSIPGDGALLDVPVSAENAIVPAKFFVAPAAESLPTKLLQTRGTSGQLLCKTQALCFVIKFRSRRDCVTCFTDPKACSIEH